MPTDVFDPIANGAIPVQKAAFDPTAHGAVKAQEPKFDPIAMGAIPATPKPITISPQEMSSHKAETAARQSKPAPSGPGYPTPAVPGNIQWHDRPAVDTDSIRPGTTGTVLSVSFNEDGMEVLVPRIYDGKVHSEKEAWDHYKKTGEHMGKFKSVADADAYGQKYHEEAEAGKFGKFPKKPAKLQPGQPLMWNGKKTSVQEVRRNNQGKYAYKIDNQWYTDDELKLK